MNTIKKHKGLLCALGIVSLVFAIGFLVGGILMLVFGIPSLVDGVDTTKGILLVVFGVIAIILFLLSVSFGVYATWIGFHLSATQGSIKQGNIAKEHGTVNMKKCDRCGTEIKNGETVCSECRKPVK